MFLYKNVFSATNFVSLTILTFEYLQDSYFCSIYDVLNSLNVLFLLVCLLTCFSGCVWAHCPAIYKLCMVAPYGNGTFLQNCLHKCYCCEGPLALATPEVVGDLTHVPHDQYELRRCVDRGGDGDQSILSIVSTPHYDVGAYWDSLGTGQPRQLYWHGGRRKYSISLCCCSSRACPGMGCQLELGQVLLWDGLVTRELTSTFLQP